ncbi:MAG: UDP-N-acetylmuramoylalanine--D-glutamate ligase [Candidatus Reconcilbacillus cellulovorans]|uniref:UDP-N-acetylmuramoylalanine--D-glutamate ligase n=1 Tax=Candidatus Reconcilbacillus cellulovorans TaxID=1906605 RepID=A0A2A6DXF6_9BACL|nr:MAG: UDP-N-acetylmuramoylalanine--D-glutamate ligase [Candidatus Reconcilbacillus cellulovorans]
MRAIVEFCINNAGHGTEEVTRRLEQEHPDIDVVEYDCMNHCALCATEPYALVNGEIVSAPTPDELYDKILAKIESDELAEDGRFFNTSE